MMVAIPATRIPLLTSSVTGAKVDREKTSSKFFCKPHPPHKQTNTHAITDIKHINKNSTACRVHSAPNWSLSFHRWPTLAVVNLLSFPSSNAPKWWRKNTQGSRYKSFFSAVKRQPPLSPHSLHINKHKYIRLSTHNAPKMHFFPIYETKNHSTGLFWFLFWHFAVCASVSSKSEKRESVRAQWKRTVKNIAYKLN